MDTTELIPIEAISQRIFIIRGVKVMLDADLAQLYGIRTMRLNQAVKRNFKRFPGDFMFRLFREEAKELNLSQNVIGSKNSFDRDRPQFDRPQFDGPQFDGPQFDRPQLAADSEIFSNRSQFVIGYQKHRDPRFLPYAFTEHGVAMLSTVLQSERAAEMSVYIVRAFMISARTSWTN